MRPNDYYKSLLANLDTVRKKAVHLALMTHVGQGRAISKPDLMKASAGNGVRFSDERQLRMTIVELRKDGVPVCSSSGEGGYFLAGTLAEYTEFRGREYAAKISDMRETVLAMDACVRAMFASEAQEQSKVRAESAGQPALL